MNKNQIACFIETLASNEKLRGQILSADDKTILQICRDNGLKDISQEESVRLLETARTYMKGDGKLSEESLDEIAAGMPDSTYSEDHQLPAKTCTSS